MAPTLNQSLSVSAWTARAEAHAERVAKWTDAFVQRRSRNEKHPVHDFLFTYYNFSPSKLRQWIPAVGDELEIDDESLAAHPWLRDRHVQIEAGILRLNPALIDDQAQRMAGFVAELCGNILERAPRLRCFGLHEWAMVYRLTPEQIRHTGYRLRLPPDDLATFIESQSLCCSHYDAFRFFTPEARPLNSLQPALDSRLQNEQGACLHANMDLYKWAYKLWPWVGSDLIADCFLLAMEGRDLDMRASPYDFADLGYEPVCIETEEGRRHYQAEQLRLAEKAESVRGRLLQQARQIGIQANICLHKQDCSGV
ncbi:MAG: hypothetical protein ACOYOF_08865 [Verrucomicrobiaceae bacterium]